MVITRQDISPGLQTAQSIHAVAGYALDYPKKFKKWDNGYVIVLAVENETELINFANCMEDGSITHFMFHEHDLNYEPTAIAFLEKECTKELTKDLPLAGRTTKTTFG